MKQYQMAALVLVFLMLMSATASGAMASVGDSGAIETDEEYQGICLDIGKNIEYSSPMVFTTTELPTIRQRPIELHSAFYDAISFQENTSITLNLFDDVTVISTINTRVEYILGITGLLGDIEGSEWGYVALSLGFETVYGTIEIPENNQRFIIHHYSDTEMHYVSEVDVFYSDEDEPQRYAPTLIPDIQSSFDDELLSLEPTFNPDPWEEVTVKMGVYFTEQASEQAGGIGQIANKIANEFTVSNSVLSNSQTYLTLEWVDTKMVTYAETGDSQTDLHALETGKIDNILQRREDCSLDLVSLIVKECDEGGRGGILKHINNGKGTISASYSLVKQSRLGDNTYVFIHEIGHNLGCSHNTEEPISPGPTIWADWESQFGEVNDWSAGYHWWDWFNLKTRLTIMSYSIGTNPSWIPRFSNPDVTYSGYPTGTDKHNNARTIRITKHIVASYMNTVSINAADGGTTSPAANIYNGVESGFFKEYDGGIKATSNQGWSFYRWHGDVPEENIHDNPLYLFVDGDKVITPEFINVVSPSFSYFEPSGWWTYNQRPTCTIDIEGLQDPHIALDLTSVEYHYSKNGGVNWITGIPVDSCTYKAGLDWLASATVNSVPFDQDSIDQNKIQFSARDVNGNYCESQIYIVKIDTALPTSSVTVSGAYWRNSAIVLTATASDACGVEDVSLWYRRSTDNATWGAWTNFGTDTASPWEWNFNWPAGQGYYQFYSKAKDNANRIESTSVADVKYGYDTIAPSTPTISSSTHTEGQWLGNNDPAFSWTPVTDISGVRYYYVWDNNPGTVPSSASPNILGTTITFSNQPDGTWYLHVRARDGAGNWGGTDHYGPVLIDTSPPGSFTVSSSTHVAGEWSANTNPLFSWTDADTSSPPITYYYVFDQISNTFPNVGSSSTPLTSVSFSSISEGQWYFHIIARNSAGIWGGR